VTLKALAGEAVARLRADIGEPAEPPVLQHFLELRYRGQEFTIAVPVPQDGLSTATYAAVRAEFDALHERLYGHQAPEETVEAIGMRTVISMPMVAVPEPTAAVRAAGVAEPVRTRPVVVHGGGSEPVPCPVYDRESLVPGQRIDGPAVVQEATSSVVFYDGDVLTVAADHSLVIAVGSRS
jgi:N-methylhydantoinase A